jgi:hypothetical protein
MVRKQLYLDERHDRALKQRAQDTGLSEAEIVRRALDATLAAGDLERSRGAEALAQFLVEASEMAGRATVQRGWTRDELYGDRPRRWRG